MSKRVVPVKGYVRKKTGKAVQPHKRVIPVQTLGMATASKSISDPPVDAPVLLNSSGNVIDPTKPFSGQDLSGLVLAPNTDWSRRVFIGSNLDNANLTGTVLQSATFRTSSFNSATLDRMKSERSSFVDVTARGASFKGTRLKESSFEGADLTEADFRGADLTETNFLGAKLQGTKFDETAFVDASQKKHRFDRYTFDQVIKATKITPKQFEFLVLGGVIVVRDNTTAKRVHGGYDPEKHYVDAWQLQNSVPKGGQE